MTYTKTNWVANVTPVTAVSMNNIENGIGQLSAATSTTPPGSPVDGQIWYFPADATNGIVWAFRYNAGSASAYKWECVGGPPLRSYVGAQENTTSTGYTTLATAGPSLTAPRAGDYRIELGNFSYNQTALFGAQMGVYLNAVDTGQAAYSGANFFNSVYKTVPYTVPTAGWQLVCLYKALSGGTASFGERFILLTPIRVS